MAVDEQAEIAELERQWREAEETRPHRRRHAEHRRRDLKNSCNGSSGAAINRPVEIALPRLPARHYLHDSSRSRSRMAAPLVQIDPRPAPAPATPAARKPSWLKVKAPGGSTYLSVQRMMRDLRLHTVCEEAHCPNIGECWEHRAATFMILGDVCTRNCAYCAVAHGTPTALDPEEPVRLAGAVEQMGLRHVVITSVDRDDLENGGAEIFAACVTEIRRRLPDTSVEVLIPDFKGERDGAPARDGRRARHPEPQPRNDRAPVPHRPSGRPLSARARAAAPRQGHAARRAHQVRPHLRPGRGMGRAAASRCATCAGRTWTFSPLGQYLRPSDGHLPIARWYTPDEFAELRRLGLAMGFRHVESGPLVRSSYHAWEQVAAATATAGPNLSASMATVTAAPERPDGHGAASPHAARDAADPPLRGEGGRGLRARQDRRFLPPLHRAGGGRGRRVGRAARPTTTSSAPTASTARRWCAASRRAR